LKKATSGLSASHSAAANATLQKASSGLPTSDSVAESTLKKAKSGESAATKKSALKSHASNSSAHKRAEVIDV